MTTLQRGALGIILGAGVAAGGFAAYKWSHSRSRRLAQKETVTSSQGLVSAVPPFSTKEPDRYQATRIITSVDGEAGPIPPSVTRILIARDGDRRREDYDGDTDLRTSYLELPSGTFVLLPSEKLYADIKYASPRFALPGQPDDADADFFPERLLNETPGAARYEKLGLENLDGRTTTKYRVTSGGAINETERQTVTLIWIDEGLGMPVRSETEVSDGNSHSKLIVELRDIKTQVDPSLFELPRDYRKV